MRTLNNCRPALWLTAIAIFISHGIFAQVTGGRKDSALMASPKDTSKRGAVVGQKSSVQKQSKKKVAWAPDTTRSKIPHSITAFYYETKMTPTGEIALAYPKQNPDTGLDNFELYTNQYTLGNTGSPVVPMIFSGAPDPLGFFYGREHIGASFHSDSNIKYYNTRAPYLGFKYVTNPKIQEFFDMWFTQNIGEKFNLAFTFERIRDDGSYLNQGTNLNQATLSLNYHSKRYIAFANAIYDVFKLHQNGGVTQDSDFFNPNYSNRQTVPINLASATSSVFHNSVHLKQYFLFGYSGNDSTKAKPWLYLSHSFTASSNAIVFNDPGPLDTTFYRHIFYNSGILTHDSLHYNEVINDVSIGSANGSTPLLRWEAGVTNQWAHIIIPYHIDSIFSTNIAHICLYNTGRFLYKIQGSAIVQGRNGSGDYHGSGALGFKPDSLRAIWLTGSMASQEPDFIYNAYYGNNFQWQNRLGKVGISSVILQYNDAKWKLNIEVKATQLHHFVYFGTDTLPHQYAKDVQLFTAQLQKTFTIGKWGWKTNEIYQYIPDSAPIHLPQLLSENSIYYQNYLFQRHMLLRVGVDVYFNTTFYVNGYMPVYDQYYLQNKTKVGNYATIDPFVSVRIKTFRLFMKFENVGSGLIESGTLYAYALHYPTNDRALRFGISWDFWN